MPRWRWWLIGMLVLAVAIAAGYFPVLKRNLRLSAQAPAKSEEQGATRRNVRSTSKLPGKNVISKIASDVISRGKAPMRDCNEAEQPT